MFSYSNMQLKTKKSVKFKTFFNMLKTIDSNESMKILKFT